MKHHIDCRSIRKCNASDSSDPKATAVRYQGGIKSDILEQQDAGSQVTVLEEMENWSKVETADAVIGYVEISVWKQRRIRQ